MQQSTIYKIKSEALQKIHGVNKSLSAAFCSWTPPTHPDKPLSFSTIFITFRGALEGLFAGCRSLIGVDGIHLKGNFGGILLSKVALDGNNELFPVAWATVPAEDIDNWKFFIWHLKNSFKDSGRGDNWCIIQIDRRALTKRVMAEVGRRYCCKHLSKNWKKAFPGPLMWFLFWKACGATSQFTFKRAMTELQKVNPTTLVWLSKLGDQSTWTKHKFNPNIKSDVNKTNFVESFNATLGVDRLRLC
ncbi:Extracellular exo-alpha-(1-_5)-L-arabinofuranosidase [Bienertia sinuspersici]